MCVRGLTDDDVAERGVLDLQAMPDAGWLGQNSTYNCVSCTDVPKAARPALQKLQSWVYDATVLLVGLARDEGGNFDDWDSHVS